MKILSKYSILLLLPAFMLVGCGEDFEEKLTGQNPESNIVWIEDGVTGFEQEVTGPGATLTAVGSNLAGVKRVLIGSALVPALHVQSTESSVTFQVPETIPLGMQELVFIYGGNIREREQIEVVPRSTVTYTNNLSGEEGDEVTFYGNYLGQIGTVTFEEVEAPIVSQTAGALTVTVPAGAPSGSLFLVGDAGTIAVPGFISCETDPEVWACEAPINENGGFEAGTVGVINNGGDHGGNWFMQGTDVPTTYSIVDAATVAGRGGRGSLTLQAEVVGPVEAGDNPWNAQAVNTIGDIPGAAYLLSAWVKGPEGTQVNVGAGLNAAPYTNYAYEEVPTTGEWVHVTFLFQTVDETGNGTNIAFHFGIPGNAGSVFHVDNVKIIPVGEWIDPVANPDAYCERYGANGGNIPDAPDCEE